MSRVVIAVVDGVCDIDLALTDGLLAMASPLVSEGLAVARVSVGGRSVRSIAGHTIDVHGPLESEPRPPVVVVPGFRPTESERLEAILSRLRPVVDWLSALGPTCPMIGACSSSALLAAEASLALGRRCAVPPWLRPFFRARYPRIPLSERTVSQVGNLVTCSSPFAAAVISGLAVARIADPASTERLRATLPPLDPLALHIFGRGAGDGAMARSIEWIQERLGEPISVRELARAIGVSERTLTRRFAAHFDQSPLQVVQRMRVARATRLLESTTLSIREVAAAVGHRDPSAFRRFFRREVGCLPSEYRRR